MLQCDGQAGSGVFRSPVTLSLSVIEKDNLDPSAHPAVIAEKAASLKHAVKRITAAERRSTWLVDRRKAGVSGEAEQ